VPFEASEESFGESSESPQARERRSKLETRGAESYAPPLAAARRAGADVRFVDLPGTIHSSTMALNGLPNETLAHAATWSSLSDLLALRAVSPAGRDAVKLAVPCHRECNTSVLPVHRESLKKADSATAGRRIEALGRVFGSGCQFLVDNIGEGPHMEAALRSFAASTDRSLTLIHIGNASMSADSVMEMCKSSPLLRHLAIWRGPMELADDCAEEISATCPLLETVQLPPSAQSPAESWVVNFPKQKELRFDRCETFYEPTNYTQIEESAKRCLGVSTCSFAECVVKPALAACLLRTRLPSTVENLNFALDCQIAASTVLTLARGFHKLVDLVLPWYFEHTTAFYDALFEARPEIRNLKLELEFMDDACFARACQFRLTHLHLAQFSQDPALSEAYVDIILASPCRQTLEDLQLEYVDIADANQLHRLVCGCPSLHDIIWKRCSAPLNGKDADIIAAIEAVLSHRPWGRFRLEEDPDRFADEA
jgi:hypothetical protein